MTRRLPLFEKRRALRGAVDRVLMDKWMRDMDDDAKAAFQRHRPRLVGLMAIEVAKVLCNAVSVAGVGLAVSMFPGVGFLATASIGEALAAVAPSVAVFLGGSLSVMTCARISRRSYIGFGLAVARDYWKVTQRYKNRPRGQFDDGLSAATLQMADGAALSLYRTIAEPWSAMRNNDMIAIGAMAGSTAALLAAGPLMLMIGLPTIGVVAWSLRSVARKQRSLSADENRAGKQRAVFHASRTSRKGLQDRMDLGLSPGATDAIDDELFENELEAAHRAKRQMNINDSRWFLLRNILIAMGMVAGALGGAPASAIAAVAVGASVVQAGLQSRNFNQPKLRIAVDASEALAEVRKASDDYVGEFDTSRDAWDPARGPAITVEALPFRVSDHEIDGLPGGRQGAVGRYVSRVGLARRPVDPYLDVGCAPGKVTAVLGDNGVGKSTFLRVLSGSVATRHAHRIRFDDRPLWSIAPEELVRNVVYLGNRSEVALPELLHDLGVHDLADPAQRSRAVGLLQDVHLAAEDAERMLAGLAEDPVSPVWSSEGQRESLMLLRLHPEHPRPPKLLLIDESFNNLDTDRRIWAKSVVRDCAQRGTTVVMALQSGEMFDLADAVIVLGRRGRVLAAGSRQALIRPHEELSCKVGGRGCGDPWMHRWLEERNLTADPQLDALSREALRTRTPTSTPPDLIFGATVADIAASSRPVPASLRALMAPTLPLGGDSHPGAGLDRSGRTPEERARDEAAFRAAFDAEWKRLDEQEGPLPDVGGSYSLL